MRKCRPSMRGCVASPLPMSLMTQLDELLASGMSRGAWRSSSAKMRCLIGRSSVALSQTRRTPCQSTSRKRRQDTDRTRIGGPMHALHALAQVRRQCGACPLRGLDDIHRPAAGGKDERDAAAHRAASDSRSHGATAPAMTSWSLRSDGGVPSLPRRGGTQR